MTRHPGLRGQDGFVLPLLLVVAVVIGVVGYTVSGLVTSMMSNLGRVDSQIEAQMLAADLKEYTKYLLAYEKIAFVDHPLRIDNARRNAMTQIWSQTLGGYEESKTHNILNVCGGYTADAKFVGNLRLGADRVFCPLYMRQPQFIGRILEDMLLDQWSQPGGATLLLSDNDPVGATMAPVFLKQPDGSKYPQGWYRLALDFSGEGGMFDKHWYERSDNSIPIYVGQRIFDLVKNSPVPMEVGARVFIDIYTDTMGFSGMLTERFIKVTSQVTLRRTGPGSDERNFTDSESFVLRIPTVKDFSIFMLYPTTATGGATDKFSQAMRVGSNTVIDGRVYFNGDIDVNLANLPQFLEPVFISGRLIEQVTPDKIGLFRQKFRRGLVTNLSAPRYILDGACPLGDPGSIEIANGTGFNCRLMTGSGPRNFTIRDYLDRLFLGGCQCHPAEVVNSGEIRYLPQVAPGVPCTSAVNSDLAGKCNADPGKVRTASLGARELVIKSSAAFIVTPVARMKVDNAAAHIYGTILGGHIDAAGGARFFSLAKMRVGLPGIGSTAALTERSEEANMIGEGVSVSIPNLPLLQSAKDGFR